jgi:uncharacterized protein (DUF1778 family)
MSAGDEDRWWEGVVPQTIYVSDETWDWLVEQLDGPPDPERQARLTAFLSKPTVLDTEETP